LSKPALSVEIPSEYYKLSEEEIAKHKEFSKNFVFAGD
jgi:hypothetical protein